MVVIAVTSRTRRNTPIHSEIQVSPAATFQAIAGTAIVPKTMRSTYLIPTIVALLLTLLVSSQRALAQNDQEIARALSCVPNDVGICISIKDAAALRETASGAFIEDTITLFATGEGNAIERVLSSVGLKPHEAFDRLLGRSVVLAIRTDDDGETQWAVRSNVSLNTLRMLKRAIAPTPRSIAGGTPLFGLEDGRFSMAIQENDTGAVLTLAPASNDTLLRQMLKPQADKGILGCDVFPLHASRLGEPDALCFINFGHFQEPDDEGVIPHGDSWIAVAATEQGNAINMTARLTAHNLAGPADAPFRPWPTQWFNELDHDASVVILDRTNNEVLEMLLGDPEQGTPGLLPWDLPDEVSVLATHRAAFVVRNGKKGDLEAAIALESDDIGALADAVDSAMPALIGCNQQTFSGLPVAAVRTCTVPSLTPLLGDGQHAQLAWNFRVGDVCNDHQNTGWWSVGLGASTVTRLGRTLASEPGPGDEQEWPWISMGVIRPARLLEAAAGVGLRLGAEGELLSRVSELRWNEVRTGSNSSIAVFALELGPEPARGQQLGATTAVSTDGQ